MPTPSPGFGFEINIALLQPIIDSVGQNIATILPVGIGIFAILIGIGLIPRLIKKFATHS